MVLHARFRTLEEERLHALADIPRARGAVEQQTAEDDRVGDRAVTAALEWALTPVWVLLAISKARHKESACFTTFS